jgi:hypothetical protein
MVRTIQERIHSVDWNRIQTQLDEWGYATTGKILTQTECDELIKMYDRADLFRSTIDMSRYRFGIGEYKYFAAPLPGLISELRESTYAPLSETANRWSEQLGSTEKYPSALEDFLALCKRHKQTRPTPLVLRYTSGGYNCLHQDIYGEVAFPLQISCVLNHPDSDFTGGEFLLVEQRPRAQSRGQVIVSDPGDFVIFPNRYRPVSGSRGFYRTNMRHGVSRVTSGSRFALGIIYHDAK